jgi:hypothetical protein
MQSLLPAQPLGARSLPRNTSNQGMPNNLGATFADDQFRRELIYFVCWLRLTDNCLEESMSFLGPVDKLDSQIGFAVIQDCFLGGGFGAWGCVGCGVAAHWGAFAG